MYILAVAQDETGGLRDKPKKNKDFYHTCYALSGLSIAQHNKCDLIGKELKRDGNLSGSKKENQNCDDVVEKVEELKENETVVVIGSQENLIVSRISSNSIACETDLTCVFFLVQKLIDPIHNIPCGSVEGALLHFAKSETN